MMRTLVPVAFAALLSGIAWAFSEEPEAKLPAVGAWARYHAINKKDTGDETVNTMTLKSLAATTFEGTACRWMETEFVDGAGTHHERRKFLIPERAVRSSEKPSDDVLKYLQRDDANPLSSVPPENEGWIPVDFLYFPGFLKNAKLVDDPRSVKHQNGTLEIPQAYVGTYKWWRKGRVPEETSVWETQYRVWLHADLPVGFAHAQAKLRLLSKGVELRSWQLDYTLQEFGDNAKPAIEEESGPPVAP